jgi:hypothetical protein
MMVLAGVSNPSQQNRGRRQMAQADLGGLVGAVGYRDLANTS